MLKQFTKSKTKKAIFICQISGSYLKVIRCQCNNGSKKEFVDLGLQTLTPKADDKEISQNLNQIFQKLEYKGNLIIVSLPRSQATCRYLKIPSSVPSEIERITSLQAPRYLPYQANELITGYQIISTDKEGYSDINLVIVHQDLITRNLRIFKELKPAKFSIVLSSYGLCNLFNYFRPEEAGSVMLIDVDAQEVELAIISNKKLLFSRSFRIDKTESNWETLFINEINKTQDTYLKDTTKEKPAKIIIFGETKNSRDFCNVLNKNINLPVEILSFSQELNLGENLLKVMRDSDNSFVSLIGLGIRDTEESLNLLPQEMKEANRVLARRKELLRLIAFICGIILIFSLAIAKNFDNKSTYLEKLKIELNKISEEAKPLEEIEKRLNLMQRRAQKELSSLDIIYELHQAIPAQISLIDLNFEIDNRLILRGQAPQLDSVFVFVSQLEKSSVFKNFNIKVRYATKSKTQTGEIIDFEIICLKR